MKLLLPKEVKTIALPKAIVHAMISKFILTTVLILSVFTLVSCNSDQKTADSNSSSSSVTDNSSSAEPKNEDKKEKENENENNTESKTQDKPQNESKKTDNKIEFSIYAIDENSLEPNKVSSISLDSNLSLNDKLTKLSAEISKTDFDGLNLEVKSIDTINGKKVATINLTDSGNNEWVPKFQGSTGGQITANTLIENYLQSNNKSNGEWIDGVKFLYNGENIEYDHVAELSEIHYK